ncbi:MFS permease [Bordetella pertussis]|uniref:MFS transporter n=1 Tax=Bordetella pertussis TaxID=520 RepID=UPI0005DEEF10|nr:MFS transporter [Bordetella pertussis]CFM37384.1 MFS permease [Bordetella pertussis]
MKSDSHPVNPAPPLWPIILAAGIVLGLSLGQRHSVGLYQLPLVQSFGLTRETFSFAIAIQNIVWGLAQPFSGYLADRYGTARVVAGGALLYVAGLLLTTVSDGRLSLTLSAGVLVGS